MMMQRALKMHTKFINQGRFFMACSAITDIGRNLLQGNFIDLAPLNPSQTLQAGRILKTSCTDLQQPFWSQYFSYEKQGGLLEKKAGDLPSVHKLTLDFQQHNRPIEGGKVVQKSKFFCALMSQDFSSFVLGAQKQRHIRTGILWNRFYSLGFMTIK